MAPDDLCVLCHAPGHTTRDCPGWDEEPGQGVAPPQQHHDWDDERALHTAAQGASAVCPRCAALDIVGLLRTDARSDVGPPSSNQHDVWDDGQHHRPLGVLRDMALRASCPVCRLIFRVFPRRDPGDGGDGWAPGTEFHVRPLRTCHRFGNIGDPRLQGDGQAGYATYVAVESADQVARVLVRNLGDSHGIVRDSTYYALALSRDTPAPGRAALSARRVGGSGGVDFGLVRSWFDGCEARHGPHCEGAWDDVLLGARMIDVAAREIVSCPSRCKYIALSYVWGGIGPEDGALARGTLPKTIEDSLTVTKNLGIKYLWV